MPWTYVYLLQSQFCPTHRYTGLTNSVPRRLSEHNAGKVASTARNRPWRLKAAIALPDRNRAKDLEDFLKSKNGRQFAQKRL
jgi:predicted GIY-YIG superfamily endonuclease